MALGIAGAALATVGTLRPETEPLPAGPIATVAVRPGDTLGGIAARIGPSDWSLAEKTARLQEANPRADMLTPGQLLRDPWR